MVLQAVAKDLRGAREALLLLGGVGGRVRTEELVELAVVEAVDRVGPADAAGVEPDDVVALAHGLADDEVGCTGVVHARAAGAAGVDDQGPDAGSAAGWPAPAAP